MPKRNYDDDSDLDDFIVDDDDDEFEAKPKSKKTTKRTPKKSRAGDADDAGAFLNIIHSIRFTFACGSLI